jgi:anti-sigma B factor antagonist
MTLLRSVPARGGWRARRLARRWCGYNVGHAITDARWFAPVTTESIVLERHDGVAVVRVHGEHDVFTAPALREQVHSAIEQRAPVVIDLSGATFIDSSVLAVLLGGLRRAREAETGFALVLPGEDGAPVRRIFEVTGLVPVFAIQPSEAEAVAAAAAGVNA